MTITRLPTAGKLRLTLTSNLEGRDLPDYQLRQVLAASDKLSVVNKALANAAVRIVNDDALGPGDALTRCEQLLPAVLNIINLCSSNDRDLSRGLRQWLQINGDQE